MTRLMVYITSIMVSTVSTAVFTASAELHQNILTIDATNRENWAYINITEGEMVDIANAASSLAWDLGFKRTEVIANGGVSGPGKTGADDGTRFFVESEPTSVDRKRKVTTTWAAIKS